MRTYYIYKATNKVNGKAYVGQTNNWRSRIWQHMRCYEKEDCLFHDAIKEYGIDNFEWELLETCNNRKQALELEKHYIELYDTYRNGYNENKGGVEPRKLNRKKKLKRQKQRKLLSKTFIT